MSSGETASCIARLMSTFSFEIQELPDKLKCTKCKSVLKDACQVPCGCRFCRACIDGLMARGGQFCPGGSQECGRTPLSTALQDYRANRSILKLTAKCPKSNCSHECPFADMEGHLRVCQTNNIDCLFRELGCLQARLTTDEMSNHLQQQNRRHSEILIEMVANINRDVLELKRELSLRDEQIGHVENENKSIQNEIKLIKNENKSIYDEMRNEMNAIKKQIVSIKREKEVLSERVRQLAEKLEQEIDERRQTGERDSAKISAVASNQDALGTEMEAVNEGIRSINRDMQFIKNQFNSMKCQVQPTPVDSSCDEWVIDTDVAKTKWGWTLGTPKTSASFTGVTHPHKYRLESGNSDSRAELWIQLRILSDPNDCQLRWPFRALVTVTVADGNKREACRKLTRQCQFEKPPHRSSSSDPFEFPHSELRTAGLDLSNGVRVSCQVIPV